MKGLKDKVAIITGAAQGIGLATAFRLAEEGVNLGLIDRVKITNNVLAALKKFKIKIMVCRADVRNYTKVKKFFGEVNKEFGCIGILINNAGIYDRRLLPDVSPKYWGEIMDNNLKSAFFCSQAAAPYMIKRGWGRIIFISSVSVHLGGKSSLVYSITKSGLLGLNRSLAATLAPNNINVNALLVGITQTDQIKIIPEPRLENLKANTLLKRFAKPEEIAAAIAFLASEESSYITGAVMNVSGGLVS